MHPAYRWSGLGALLLVTLTHLAPASAQTTPRPGEVCTVQVLNQTVPVKPDGSWKVSNIPATGDRIRARLVCDDGVIVRTGQGPLMRVTTNRSVGLSPIEFGPSDPAPDALEISGVPAVVAQSGAQMQLTVTGSFPNGVTEDVTATETGTDYFSTNPAALHVSEDGLLTALQSGNVLVTVTNQGITAAISVKVQLGADSDGDGLPDDWETSNGLDPNDATDAYADGDADGLTNSAEFICGTAPMEPDTDSDGLADGEEVTAVTDNACETTSSPLLKDTDGDLVPDAIELITGTSPTNPSSYDLDAALLEVVVKPEAVNLPLSPLLGEALYQLTLTGILIDGSGIDLTSHPDTVWLSNKPSVLAVTPNPGEVLGVADGQAQAIGGVESHSATSTISVKTFVPSALGYVDPEGLANNVDLQGGLAYVATTSGLTIAQLQSGGAPTIVSEIEVQDAKDVKASGSTVLLAGPEGLSVIDASVPQDPVVLSTVPMPWAFDLDVSGDLATVATNLNMVHVVDFSDPNDPVLIGSVEAPQPMTGIATEGPTGVISLAGSAYMVLDLEDPTAPSLSEVISLPAPTYEVDLEEGLAVFASYSSGLSTVDLSDPANPVYLGTAGAGDYLAHDIEVVGDRAFTTRFTAPVGAAIASVSDPSNVSFVGLVSFTDGPGGKGLGIAADNGFVALIAGGVLHVGLYAALTDNLGVPPVATLLSPSEGDLFIEGTAIPIVVSASDDIAIERVEFFMDGALIGVRSQPPFTFNLLGLPVDTVVTLHAEAVDLAGDRGATTPVNVAVVPDPMTTVVGQVVAPDGQPVEGAFVSTFDQGVTAITSADGTFTLADVPSYKPVFIAAKASLSFTCVEGTCGEVFTACIDTEPCAAGYGATAGPTPAIGDGETDVGVLTLEGTQLPTVMTGVVARPWTFGAYTAQNGGEAATLMSGVVARPWTFGAFAAQNEGEPLTLMAGVVARPWTFGAYADANEGEPTTLMSGVVARPWSFGSFPSVNNDEPVSLMSGVVARPWTFASEDP